MDPYFLTAVGLLVLTVISPGPAVLAILSTGMAKGRREALALTAGVVSGSFVWAMIALFGFVGILEQLGAALVWLKVAGGLYLLWLAHKALRNAWSKVDPSPADLGPTQKFSRLYVAGLTLHLTNPKAVLGWAATITVGVRPGATTADAAILVFTCIAIVATLKTTMALGFSTRAAMGFYLRARRWIQGVTGTFFATAGTALIVDAVRR